MIHPLLQLIATKPQLLGDHAEAYAELISAEIAAASKVWMSRVALLVAAALFLAAGIIFSGVALMLWAVVPAEGMNAPWLLIAVPMVSLIVGAVCLVRARAEPHAQAFKNIKEQLQADFAMLREVSAAT